MFKLSLLLAAFGGLLLFSPPLMAQPGACWEEIEDHCAQHRGDHNAMMQCFEQNQDLLSSKCKQAIKDGKGRYGGGPGMGQGRGRGMGPGMALGQGPCRAEIQTHCAKHRGNHQAMMKCFDQNKAKLSPKCKQALKEGKGRYGGGPGMGQGRGRGMGPMGRGPGPCKDDVRRFCASHRGDHPAMMDCLKKNQDKLAPNCKKSLRP